MKHSVKFFAALSFVGALVASCTSHAFSFRVTQNTIWRDLTIYVENCQKVQGSQSCNFQLLNNQEGGSTSSCDGNVYDGNYKHTCYSLDQHKGYVYLVLNGNNAAAGRCKVTNGQTVEVRSLCSGVEKGKGDGCPGGESSSTFKCNVI